MSITPRQLVYTASRQLQEVSHERIFVRASRLLLTSSDSPELSRTKVQEGPTSFTLNLIHQGHWTTEHGLGLERQINYGNFRVSFATNAITQNLEATLENIEVAIKNLNGFRTLQPRNWELHYEGFAVMIGTAYFQDAHRDVFADITVSNTQTCGYGHVSINLYYSKLKSGVNFTNDPNNPITTKEALSDTSEIGTSFRKWILESASFLHELAGKILNFERPPGETIIIMNNQDTVYPKLLDEKK